MKAHLLTIGDELLIGQTTNTNAAWLGERLSRLGLEVERTVTVGDDPDRMREELDRSTQRADLIVMTGGLGPTHDDVTREVVADALDAPRPHPALLRAPRTADASVGSKACPGARGL
jgi:nicotinamide-nucleotide amidase